MEWLAILEIVMKLLADCRAKRSRADVIESVRRPGPFGRAAIWFQLRKEGLSGKEMAEAMSLITSIGEMSEEDASFFVGEVEQQATAAGQPLFEAVPTGRK